MNRIPLDITDHTDSNIMVHCTGTDSKQTPPEEREEMWRESEKWSPLSDINSRSAGLT